MNLKSYQLGNEEIETDASLQEVEEAVKHVKEFVQNYNVDDLIEELKQRGFICNALEKPVKVKNW
ncbi:hypothetical protein bcgnr5378_07200 [Bacillus cereus]|uniref:Uncharacterized protein n=1 Tax=Bacillus cereus TaxID=1396 RepID=A0A164NXR5_BACCE|nr:hypothetical protein [Bacillus cereus]KZD65974.1 hypothetical protein B4088_2731 [Bacillus cereus]